MGGARFSAVMPTTKADAGRKEGGGVLVGVVAWCYSEAKRPGKVRPIPGARWADEGNIYEIKGHNEDRTEKKYINK